MYLKGAQDSNVNNTLKIKTLSKSTRLVKLSSTINKIGA